MEDKLIEAITDIVWYNGHRDLFKQWKSVAEDCMNKNDSMLYPDWCPSWGSEEHCLWMIFVSYFGDWGTSIRSGWINSDNLQIFIDILSEIINKTQSDNQ